MSDTNEPIEAEFTVRESEAVMQAVAETVGPPDPVQEHVERVSRNLRTALQHAVERGKLRPFEAIEAAEHFGVQLEPWVQRQHDHYVRTNGTGVL